MRHHPAVSHSTPLQYSTVLFRTFLSADAVPVKRLGPSETSSISPRLGSWRLSSHSGTPGAACSWDAESCACHGNEPWEAWGAWAENEKGTHKGNDGQEAMENMLCLVVAVAAYCTSDVWESQPSIPQNMSAADTFSTWDHFWRCVLW